MATNIVNANGMLAKRVNKPKTIKMEQKNSAKVVKYKEVAAPSPNGSPNWEAFPARIF